MPADVIILGDSHAIACSEGARMMGLNPAFFYASGLAWHGPRFEFHRKRGLVSKRPHQRQRLAVLADQLGTHQILETGLPIIASVGFHLGHLARPLTWNGHVPAQLGAPMEAPCISRRFIEAYVQEYRARHFDLLQKLSSRTRLAVVGPPPINETEPFTTVRDIIGERLKTMGITYVDPRRLFPSGATSLPPALIAEDGGHGTSAYGALIIERLIREGFLAGAKETVKAVG